MTDQYVTQTILKKELAKSNALLKTELREEMRQFFLDQDVRLKRYVDEVSQVILQSVAYGFEEVHVELKLIRQDIRVLAEKVEKHERFFTLLNKKFPDIN